ncbi:hypothetical protein BKA70DRAFT_197528 [Coprinopsis sp. MPI-PUGE-AT-0042]|nr:hypothetical protein BKA70DRAFT_197528 [Coprinopsis sp. MPI-PUGE-AT-0042]
MLSKDPNPELPTGQQSPLRALYLDFTSVWDLILETIALALSMDLCLHLYDRLLKTPTQCRKASRHIASTQLLVFKNTRTCLPYGHPSKNADKPDIVAAFQENYQETTTESDSGDHGESVLWQCIRLVGKDASKRRDKARATKQATKHHELLLLARPDFKASLGLLLNNAGMIIMVGVGGEGVLEFPFTWGTDEARCAAHTLIFCLYGPGSWLDPEIRMVYHPG